MQAPPVSENELLLAYLLKSFKDLSRTKIKESLTRGLVLVNGQPVSRYDFSLKKGDRVEIASKNSRLRAVSKVRLSFPILYDDEVLIVIDKPAGLLTVGTDREKRNTAYFQLNEYLKAQDPSKKSHVLIVHRLDRDASGLLVFAKTNPAKYFLQTHWPEFQKKYYALVERTPKKNSGTIQSYLAEDKFRRVYSTEKSEEAKYSVTHYRVLESDGRHSLLEVELETGRKNQIRVHLADLGHPIAGDEKYGSHSNPIRRLGLHSCFLSFKHPVTGEFKTFSLPIPAQFLGVLSRKRI